jgi:hypothetical protein
VLSKDDSLGESSLLDTSIEGTSKGKKERGASDAPLFFLIHKTTPDG